MPAVQSWPQSKRKARRGKTFTVRFHTFILIRPFLDAASSLRLGLDELSFRAVGIAVRGK
jgi:hypothetical protein